MRATPGVGGPAPQGFGGVRAIEARTDGAVRLETLRLRALLATPAARALAGEPA